MQIRIVYPTQELKHLVQYFWILEMPGIIVAPQGIRTFADDSSGIIFHHYDGYSALKKDEKNLPVGLIYGQTRIPSICSVQNPFSAVGVLFHPHAINSIFRVDAHYLTDSFFSVDEFDKESDLRERMLHEEDPEKKIRIFSEFLIGKSRRVGNPDMIVMGSIRLIKEFKVTQVKELLQYFRISERQLERRFLVSVGVSPRHYFQMNRFQGVIHYIRNKRFDRLSEVASQFNFSDQAHFNRMFRKFSGLNPKRFQGYFKNELINVLFS